MGDFFTSPRERASTNLYNAATSGHPIGEGFFRASADTATQNLQRQTSERTAGVGGDILSRLASMGVSPGASSEALTSKAIAPIVAGEQQGETAIQGNLQDILSRVLLNELNTGLSGMSSSSTFGNILAGLQTAGNLASGGWNLFNAISTGTQTKGGFGGGGTLYEGPPAGSERG